MRNVKTAIGPNLRSVAGVCLTYGLLALSLVIYSNRIPNTDSRGIVDNEIVVGHILASFRTIRSLRDNSVFLVRGIDFSRYPDLPWEDAPYADSQLGVSKYFLLLAPDRVVAFARLDLGGHESQRFVLAEGRSLEQNPPDYILQYDDAGNLKSVESVVAGPSQIDSAARLIPDLSAILGTGKISDLSVAARRSFDERAAYWGLFDAITVKNVRNAKVNQKVAGLIADARKREAELAKVDFSSSAIAKQSGRNAGRSVRLDWNAPGSGHTEIHVDEPDGNLLAVGGSFGFAVTGAWVTDATRFYLTGAFDKKNAFAPMQLGYIAPQHQNERSAPEASTEPLHATAFEAEPNPISVDGSGLGKTTLRWNVPYPETEIHIGSADGQLFTREGGSGSAETGLWVTNGMKFFLVVDQASTGGKKTLAIVTISASDVKH